MAFYCDGLRRRDFLRIGTLGLCGLNLPCYLRHAEAAGVNVDRSAVFIFLGGGQSHIDTWDMKPDAPAEYRGTFQPIQTSVPGIEISELLPRMAAQADKYAILRNVRHGVAAHGFGQVYLRTGNPRTPALEYPCYGPVVAKERQAAEGLPPYIALPISVSNTENARTDSPGYLGVAYSPLTVGGDPNSPGFGVRALTMPKGLSLERIDNRRELLEGLDTAFRDADVKSQDLAGMDRFYQRAYDILRSERTRAAFDLAREPEHVRDRYGRTSFGQGCLLARRLIEAGVRFVSIDFGGWDMHGNTVTRLRELAPQLDAGLASLLEELSTRGLLQSTAVFMATEFGRTPKLKSGSGRDHWSRAMSLVMAGGGVRGGQVIGRTTDKAEEPAEDPRSPEDVAASFYHALGIDHHKEYHTPTGRPVQLVRDGTIIRELFS
jgi:uncharacterized protein (DUF1501 family)